MQCHLPGVLMIRSVNLICELLISGLRSGYIGTLTVTGFSLQFGLLGRLYGCYGDCETFIFYAHTKNPHAHSHIDCQQLLIPDHIASRLPQSTKGLVYLIKTH